MTAPRTRSYVRREGRITKAQAGALETLWEIYGVDLQRDFDALSIFSRQAPLMVEIGFGNGEALAAMAAADPHSDFLGIEVYRPGIGHLLLRLKKRELSNVRVYHADAEEVLTRKIPDGVIQAVNLFFPDPWPKKRHHKRRLLSPAFVTLLARKLTAGGCLHITTDWRDYAEEMQGALTACALLENMEGTALFAERSAQRPVTKFEIRGIRGGHRVFEFLFRKREPFASPAF